jgi:nicotinamidase-related amidase
MRLRRSDSMLLVVDVQEGVAPAVHEGARVIARCAALVRAARLFAVPALLSEHCPDVLGPIVPELLAVAPEDSRMRKMFFGCADEDECLRRIDSTGRQQVVIAGMEAHVCITQTALGLAERGFEVFIAQDAVGSNRLEDSAVAVERMRAAGASIVTAEMALIEWMHRAEGSEWLELQPILMSL